MLRSLAACLAIAAVIHVGAPADASVAEAAKSPPSASHAGDRAAPPTAPSVLRFGLPFQFEVNRGQFHPDYDLFARCRGYTAHVRSDRAVLSLDGHPLALDFRGMPRATPDLAGRMLPGVAHSFIGSDPKAWRTHIPTAKGAVFHDDDGVSIAWDGDGRNLRFTFELAPGAQPPAMVIGGARTASVAASGALELEAPAGKATISRPVAWQETASGRRAVAAEWTLAGATATVALGTRDPALPVTVDPTVTYATYLGSAGADTYGIDGALDAQKRLHFSAKTSSTAFPTTSGAFDRTLNAGQAGSTDAVVGRFSADGQTLEWSTYYGGTGSEEPRGIALASDGDPVLAGMTAALATPGNFPVTSGAYKTSVSSTNGHGYLIRIDSNGASVVAGTYGDRTHEILALNSKDEPVVFGQTLVYKYSADLTQQSFAYEHHPNPSNGATSTLDLAVGANDDIFICGSTDDSRHSFTAGKYDSTLNGRRDAYCTKLNTSGVRQWVTLIGGSHDDWAAAMAIDGAGRLLFAVYTRSIDFPTTSGAVQQTAPAAEGVEMLAIAKLSADGTSLRYSTYYSGSDLTHPADISAHVSGAYAVCGYTVAGDFPVVDALQASMSGGSDAFAVMFDRDDEPMWSTYLGGSGSNDEGTSIPMASDGTVGIVSSVLSADIPTTSPYQATNAGSWDLFLHLIPDTLPTDPFPKVSAVTVPPTTLGRPLSAQMAQTDGVAPITWRVAAGALPSGVTMSSTGLVSGTPAAAGSFKFTAEARDKYDLVGTREFTLVVNPLPAVSTAKLPDWTRTIPYSQTLAASNGTPPHSWQILAGSLPPGLSMDAAGAVTGTPTSVGFSTFTVGLTDSVGATASKQFSVSVHQTPSITPINPPQATTGRGYLATFLSANGAGTPEWAVSAGDAPTADGIGAEDGRMTGLAKDPGTYAFTLRVTDDAGATAERAFQVTVNDEPTVATAGLPPGAVGRPYGVTLSGSGGTSPSAWRTSAGELPAGLALDRTSGRLSGTPEAPGDAPISVERVDYWGGVGAAELLVAVVDRLDLAAGKAKVSMGAAGTWRGFVEVLKGTLLDVTASGDAPTVSIADASGAPLDVAAWLRSTPKSARVSKFPVPATGRYFLAATPAEGSEKPLKVSVKASIPASAAGSVIAVPDAGSRDGAFSAPPGAVMTCTVSSAKKSAAVPAIDGLFTAGGAAVPGVASAKGKKATFVPDAPLAGGDYVIRFRAASGGEGGLDWNVRMKLPKRNEFALPDLAQGD